MATYNEQKLEAEIASLKLDAQMYADAWQRELGPYMGPKRHHIDACVLGTQNLRAAAKYKEALDRWRRDTLVARTLGMPDFDLIDYLPQ